MRRPLLRKPSAGNVLLWKATSADLGAKLRPPHEIIIGKVQPIHPEDRPVERLLKKRLSDGEKSIFYDVHKYRGTGSWAGPPGGEIKAIIENRLAIIQNNAEIRMIEQLDFKRRWQTEPWEEQEQRALKNWLLDRLEDKRCWPRIELQSTAQLADHASADAEFMQVAALYRGRAGFDLAALIGELVEGESVPFLPILRYKASGLRKREVWERTWDLQRKTDDYRQQRREADELIAKADKRLAELLKPATEKLELLANELREVRERFGRKWLSQKKKLSGETPEQSAKRLIKELPSPMQPHLEQLELLANRCKRETDKWEKARQELYGNDEEYQSAVKWRRSIPEDPDISVPPKYTTADFQKTDYWRLRGKLDLPKERWISYRHCQSVSDPTLVVGWAGWNHLEQATALVTYYDARKREGWDAKRLTPLLAGLQQLLPWIHQWHPEIDTESGKTAGQDYQSMVEQDAYELGLTLEDIRTWQPPEMTARRRTRK